MSQHIFLAHCRIKNFIFWGLIRYLLTWHYTNSDMQPILFRLAVLTDLDLAIGKT